ncbi:g11582 [Coccomyxa elongata]
MAICFLLAWLGTFKVLGLCINRGSLCERLDCLQFLAVLWMPITPQSIQQNPLATAVGITKKKINHMPRIPSNARISEEAGTYWQLLSGFIAKAVTLGVVVYLLTAFSLPRQVVEILYAVGLYAFLGLLMDGPASLASSLIGLKIAPHFDKPFLSSSVTDFWSRRWNLTAGNALRFLVYDPITERRLVKTSKGTGMPSIGRRRLGVAASFIVSGIVHEVILWYGIGWVAGVSGGWFIFFSIQGPLLAVESELRRWARRNKVEVPHWMAILVTLTLLITLGDFFFFKPPMETGLADTVVESLMHTYGAMWTSARHLLGF